MVTSTWNNAPEDIKKYQGFVYLIKEKDSGMLYIGKKNFWNVEKQQMLKGLTEAERKDLDKLSQELLFAKTKRTNRRKTKEEKGIESKIKTVKRNWKKRVSKLTGRKRQSIVESDWRDYKSSNRILQEKIEDNPSNYEKNIIELCTNKQDMAIYETAHQIKAYFNGEWDRYYNEIINLRVRIRKVKNEPKDKKIKEDRKEDNDIREDDKQVAGTHREGESVDKKREGPTEETD